jgi:hypothetical protein
MNTATRPAALRPAPAPTLDDRLALARLAMDARLAAASADMLIRTAHIPTPDVEIGPPILTAPDRPLAQLLTRAAHRLATVGWSQHSAVTGAGAICPLWAIRAEAGSEREEGEARSLLLEAIRSEAPDVVSVPYWNARQTGPSVPIRMLHTAARLADHRGI